MNEKCPLYEKCWVIKHYEEHKDFIKEICETDRFSGCINLMQLEKEDNIKNIIENEK